MPTGTRSDYDRCVRMPWERARAVIHTSTPAQRALLHGQHIDGAGVRVRLAASFLRSDDCSFDQVKHPGAAAITGVNRACELQLGGNVQLDIKMIAVVVGMTTLPTTSLAWSITRRRWRSSTAGCARPAASSAGSGCDSFVPAAPERPVGPSSLEPVVAPAQLEVLTVVLPQDIGVLGR